MSMWKSFTNLKDTLGQVATDILDTTEELEGNGSPHPYINNLEHDAHVSNFGSGTDIDQNAELLWYRNEVNRLQTTEAELSINYVKLLKEKEAEADELRKQNGELKSKLVENGHEARADQQDAASAFRESTESEDVARLKEAIKGLQAELQRTQTAGEEQLAALQDNHRKRTDALIARYRREVAALQDQVKGANHVSGDSVTSNGDIPRASSGKIVELEQRLKKLQEREKDLARQVVEKDQSYGKLKNAVEQAAAETRSLKEALENQKALLSDAQSQLEKGHDAAETATRECMMLKAERQRMVAELAEFQRRVEGQGREDGGRLEKLVEAQEIEIQQLKKENATLQQSAAGRLNNSDGAGVGGEHKVVGLNGGIFSGESLSEIKARAMEAELLAERLKAAEAASSSQREAFEQKLATVSLERDKAKKDLARLKQHLLDKETQESEKMEIDMERLSDLEGRFSSAEHRAKGLETALSAARAEAEEAKARADTMEKRTSGEAERLKKELAEAEAALDAKDKELDCLQTALGQYYAESEGQERLHGELSAAREEVKRLTAELEGLRTKVASQALEVEKGCERLVVVEAKFAESQGACVKLQDEVTRLRRALEHSMTRVNRMSADSDYLVDRRIVVKLLVTFFERNHSREVVDLMAKILCFSDEDKQRVGLAQQARGGVVRGVFAFPGRFVGGLIGAAVPETPRAAPVDEGQSFADLWIDFLVRESEERERRDQERRDRERAETDTLLPPGLPPSHPLSPHSRQQRLSSESTSSPTYPKHLGGSPSHHHHHTTNNHHHHLYRGAGGGGMNDVNSSPQLPLSSSSGDPLSSPPRMSHSRDEGGEGEGGRPHAYGGLGSANAATTPLVGIKDSDQGYTSGGEFSPIPLHSMTPPTATVGGTFGNMHVPRP